VRGNICIPSNDRGRRIHPNLALDRRASYLNRVSIVPIYGHETLRQRLRNAAARGTLASSLLLHGPRGVGKQRLALWLGQLLLCAAEGERPCGRCQHCKYAAALVHPDLHWFFPRPRLKDTDPDPETVREDYRDAIAERAEHRGLYLPSDGTEAIYVAAVRALLRQAVLSPALARRKVFVVGDAERMVAQEGADQAANAFLKLLEEPLADTTLVLTSSEPGALLPTIRSRVVAIRVAPLSEASVRQFLADPAVADALADSGAPSGIAERVQLAQGAPGALLAASGLRDALDQASRLLAAATSSDTTERLRLAFAQGSSKARGGFTQMLDALTVLLHQRVKDAAIQDDPRAGTAARALEAVERTKAMATGNVNPQLLSTALMRQIGILFR
jgi:DNA polymerase-3 subunit delta'